jgi:hypothetical protein
MIGEEIHATYPELVIASERPKWMTDERFEEICDLELHDINGAPWGILNALIADRDRA